MTSKTYTKETMPEKFKMDVVGEKYTGTYDKIINTLTITNDICPDFKYNYDLEFANKYFYRGDWVITPIEECKDSSLHSPTALPEKWKINIASFADENDIELDVAHTIVQKWLFEQGYGWYDGHRIKFQDRYFLTNTYLYGCTSGKQEILQGDDVSFYKHPAKEVKLSISLKIESIEPETITYNGKVYDKQKFEDALRSVTPLKDAV